MPLCYSKGNLKELWSLQLKKTTPKLLNPLQKLLNLLVYLEHSNSYLELPKFFKRFARQLIASLIVFIAGMSFYPMPFDLVILNHLV